MRFRIDRLDLHEAITKTEGIIPDRETHPVLSRFLIETSTDSIALTSTNLEVVIRARVKAEVDEPGEITVPARQLSQTVRESRTDRFSAESDNGHRITIRDAEQVSGARICFVGGASDQFPPIPAVPEEGYGDFPPALTREMMGKTQYSTAQEDARYVFNGLFLRNEGNRLAMVGTDGRRLSAVERVFPEELPLGEGIIIANEAVRQLHRLLDSAEKAEVAYDEEKSPWVFFRIGNSDLMAKPILGAYPDYRSIIPKKTWGELTISRALLASALRQVSVMAPDPARQVRVALGGSNLILTSSTPHLGEAEDSLKAEYAGEPMTLAFNADYLLDVITNSDAEHVNLGVTSPMTPALLRDPDDEDFLSLIMPMRIDLASSPGAPGDLWSQ